MDTQAMSKWRDRYKSELMDNVLPWWETRFLDRESGGFLTYRDADGSLLSTDKPVWVLGRIVWMWSRFYNHIEQRSHWLEVARHGVEFMLRHVFDRDGRMFWTLTREGRPLRKRRYLFTETFGTIALAEYAAASGSEEMLDRARRLYRLILMYARTPGLLPPKLITETRQLRGHALPMILLATSQVMREHDQDPLYEDTIQRCLDEVLGDFVKPDRRCLLETIQADGSMLDTPEGRTVNPGHAIETSWFILEEARRRQDRDLVQQACRILEWSLDIGWDPEHGGILYFVDCEGKPAEPYEHDMKLWWPHTEALYACLLALHLTGDGKWETWHDRISEWSFSHFPDRRHGEWYGYLRKDGSVSSPVKGNLWKGPFHLPRALLNCWKLLDDGMNASG